MCLLNNMVCSTVYDGGSLLLFKTYRYSLGNIKKSAKLKNLQGFNNCTPNLMLKFDELLPDKRASFYGALFKFVIDKIAE